ncbi:YjjG family noncanonical pyrimidine nucleotidase [Planococcus sp. N028]|uniref:YjjG family noncanonical pyrimidine nucleotidase n=1 Tax=Planococcus shixiaomingii TaxID=3058393 RepID=A0ABT8MZC7_9BACL|nr:MULTISPECIES: YjjG family noncanonical pyrimidine nucleotidase [unclassified Planococcus (in: firmicutes)]MDN7241003.1 YjjG family noncanonical pyrimidine nucleotidase [Planococcus sp. N028]WKA53257.1 YjjG family noncanonical pyrimidine nucleotidase [Planococcus sp. N022]
MGKYETIFFDVDDTLFDFGQSERNALHNTFMEYKLPEGMADYHASYRQISNKLWADLEKGKIALRDLGIERFQRLFLEHDLETDARLFSSSYLSHLGKEAHLMPGAEELCCKLSGYKLAIITNGFMEVQHARIENSPLCGKFEHIIVSEATGFQKPHRGIFDYAFEKLQLTEKENVLMVGDSLMSDIQGGNNYGIDTCWFNPLRKRNTTSVTPTYEIHHLLELIDIIK